jgi:hypothetical protein
MMSRISSLPTSKTAALPSTVGVKLPKAQVPYLGVVYWVETAIVLFDDFR